MNILSFDFEEWYLEMTQHGGRKERFLTLESTLDLLLADLRSNNIRATFFSLGKMASDYPEIMRKVVAGGHDIGCHSNTHKWLTSMTPEELRQDTTDAIHALEDVCGVKVNSYRSPAFSITPKNAWAVEVLAECGIEIDSSIFPASRDFGGFPTFGDDSPCRISYHGATIKEFPITIMSLLGKRMAFSGGGYFRLLPFGMVRQEMNRRDYNISYFHLLDLIPEQKKLMTRKQYEEYFKQPATFKNRMVRYIKNNIGSGDAFGKLEKLMTKYDFISIAEAEKRIDWKLKRIVEM